MSKSHSRIYDPASSVVFCKTRDTWGEFSNMCHGFPITIDIDGRDVTFKSTEHLYQILKHPTDRDLQHRIAETPSAYWAKKVAYEKSGDPQFVYIRIDIMRWMLYLKHSHYVDTFTDLFVRTKDLPIVELSSRDRFWGAVKHPNGFLEGYNTLGRLWMERRLEASTAQNRVGDDKYGQQFLDRLQYF